MAEIIINDDQQAHLRDTVSFLLRNVGIDERTASDYDDFLLAEDGEFNRVTRTIKHASLALGRIYFCSMNGQQSSESAYEPGEQLMLGLITGRTVKEDPKPIVVASIDYAESHARSDLVARQCVGFALSGIQKLRLRSDEQPKLFKSAKEAIIKTNTKFKLF